MKKFFTSDTHLGHANIIKYANRPYYQPSDFDANGEWKNFSIKQQRAREMDADLVKRWNSVVTNEDDVYHLGDFCFGDTGDAIGYINQLNFNKFYFIWGNHDSAMENLWKEYNKGGVANLQGRIIFLGNMKEIKVENQPIVLNHYAMRVWNRSHHGAWHLYGHSHGSLPDDPTSRSFDCGVDCHDLTPISFEQVSKLMAKKHWQPLDHHGERKEGGGFGLNQTDYERLERKRQYAALKKEFEP
jgi:calcineurin-like phosphoesterase family protein